MSFISGSPAPNKSRPPCLQRPSPRDGPTSNPDRAIPRKAFSCIRKGKAKLSKKSVWVIKKHYWIGKGFMIPFQGNSVLDQGMPVDRQSLEKMDGFIYIRPAAAGEVTTDCTYPCRSTAPGLVTTPSRFIGPQIIMILVALQGFMAGPKTHGPFGPRGGFA